MARGEGDSPLKSNFVERVVKLPVVHRALDYATNTYSHIKESSRLANFTLTNAEKTATFVAGQAKPVVLKFEKQICIVDELACRGLGTLEEKVPFIKKPADEILGDTRKLYASTVHSRLADIRRYGNDKVRSAADFGLKRAAAVLGESAVRSVLASVDSALATAQGYLDLLLPPSTDEKQSNGTSDGKETPSALVRLARLSSAIRRRTYKTVLVQVENFQEKAFDLFLIHPIRLIEISKTNLDAAIVYTHKLWIAIWQQEVPETNETEKHRAPAVVVAARDGILSLLGILKVIPQLLPTYLCGLVSWLDELRASQKESKDGRMENGSRPSSTPADDSGISEEN